MSQFILDTSRLSGGNLNYVETIIEDRGRGIQLEWVQAGSNQDIQILGYAVRAIPGETVAQEPS
jgi:hypothetical protein